MLKEQLQKDLVDALKSGDQLKRTVLGMVSNSIKQRELQNRAQVSKTITDAEERQKQSQLTDEQIMEVFASEIKKRKESIDIFKTAGRNELAKKEESEINILKVYMPEQLDEATILTEVKEAISNTQSTSMKDMGKVMGIVTTKLKGKADGSVISRIVKEELSK